MWKGTPTNRQKAAVAATTAAHNVMVAAAEVPDSRHAAFEYYRPLDCTSCGVYTVVSLSFFAACDMASVAFTAADGGSTTIVFPKADAAGDVTTAPVATG